MWFRKKNCLRRKINRVDEQDSLPVVFSGFRYAKATGIVPRYAATDTAKIPDVSRFASKALFFSQREIKEMFPGAFNPKLCNGSIHLCMR